MSELHPAAAEGFEKAPDSYERGRPEYPAAAVSFLVEKLGIGPGQTVVDLGAGTGKFTRLLVPSGAEILAVEPVRGMRDKLMSLSLGVRALEGKAEEMPLEAQSVDAVVVAQAFHWFDGAAALTEIHRVLKPGGRLGMIWNVRDESIPWIARLTEIIDSHEKGAPRYKSGNWRKAFASNSLFSPLERAEFSHVQKGNVDMVVDRIASISFISALPVAEKERVLGQVREAVPPGESVEFPYLTDLFWCAKR